MTGYEDFLRKKVVQAPLSGLEVPREDLHPKLFEFQKDAVGWALRGGRRALFESFGLGKTMQQLEIARQITNRYDGQALIVLPLGVKQEFTADAQKMDTEITYVRTDAEASVSGPVVMTNYERVRDRSLSPGYLRSLTAVLLDEASVLRGFGGTKTFREFMRLLAGDGGRGPSGTGKTGDGIPFRFVATATPSPNDFIELLAYAAFLGVMDVSEAKTRFFKRDSTKADKLTLHAHKEREFWLWVSTWALFITTPSDLGYSDEGYDLPPLDVKWHEIPTDHAEAGEDASGQGRLLRNAALGIADAAREKRDSLPARVGKLMELRTENPDAHRLIWHDLEAERRSIEAAIPGVVTVYGSQDLDVREESIIAFSRGDIQELATKPVIAGSGCNFQRYCAWAVFLGIGFKFNDFIQAIHRIQRFLQTKPVRIDLIYTEAERDVRRQLERKWAQHTELVANMTAIVREFGLAHAAGAALDRSMETERREESGAGWSLVNNDCVDETAGMESDSVGLILTSIPFSSQYEYTPSYRDFGHTDTSGGIALSPPPTTCCGHGGSGFSAPWRRGLSPYAAGAGRVLPRRCGMPGVRGGSALAGRVCVRGLWRVGRGLASIAGASRLPTLSKADLGAGGNRVPPHALAPASVVSRCLGAHEPEIRSQCSRAPARARTGKLQDSVGLAPQAPPGHGPTGSRPAERRCASGRELCRGRGGWSAGPRDDQEGHRRDRRRGRRTQDRENTAALGARPLRSGSARLRQG